jgi:hypothetical protein
LILQMMLEALGLKPGEPLPPEIQAVVNEQVKHLADDMAIRVAQLLAEPNELKKLVQARAVEALPAPSPPTGD